MFNQNVIDHVGQMGPSVQHTNVCVTQGIDD